MSFCPPTQFQAQSQFKLMQMSAGYESMGEKSKKWRKFNNKNGQRGWTETKMRALRAACDNQAGKKIASLIKREGNYCEPSVCIKYNAKLLQNTPIHIKLRQTNFVLWMWTNRRDLSGMEERGSARAWGGHKARRGIKDEEERYDGEWRI